MYSLEWRGGRCGRRDRSDVMGRFFVVVVVFVVL